MISLIDYFVRANVPETKKEFSNFQPTMNYEKLIKGLGVHLNQYLIL